MMVVKYLRRLFGLKDVEQEQKEETQRTIKTDINIIHSEDASIGTVNVSDYHIVQKQTIPVNLGLIKLVDNIGKTLVTWEGSALRPIKATIYYSYKISCAQFSTVGSGTVRNAEDIITQVIIPKFSYPCQEDKNETRIIHYYGSADTPRLPVEVIITIGRIDFEEKPLTLTPSAIVMAEPDITLPRTITYKAALEPSKTSAVEYIGRRKDIVFDKRPPEIIMESLTAPLYPTYLTRMISNDLSMAAEWMAVKDVYEDDRFKEKTSNKQLEINYEKPHNTRIFIMYDPWPNADGRWIPITYGESLDNNRISISLPENTQYVNIQVLAYPIDVLNAGGIAGIEFVVNQDVLIDGGYRFERKYGEYRKNGNIAGIRIYMDVDNTSRLWSVHIKPITFPASHKVSAEVDSNTVSITASWSGGAVEEPASDILFSVSHIDQTYSTLNRVEGVTDKNGKVVIDISAFKPNDGDLLVIRYQGLYYGNAIHGYYQVEDITYRFSDGRWIRR